MDSLKEIRARLEKGNLVILIDDFETQSSYLMGLAETVTGQHINLMTKIGKGLIYVCIDNRKAKQLNLPLMNGKSNPNKNFTITIDHHSTTTGISAFERADTIIAVVKEDAKPEEFRKPGHVFPLVYSDNGMLDHMGVVEASADLAKISSSSSNITYVCEILNKKGDMATIKEVVDISKEFNIPAIKITEVFKLLDAVSICTLEGTIVHGQKIGRRLGFPTANLKLHTSKDCLKNGVYGVKVNWRGLTYYGVMNAGVKPTLNNKIKKTYEIHLFDFNYTIYGEEINVEVKFFIREEIKFSSTDHLIQQIENDIKNVNYKLELQQMGKIRL